MDPILKPSACFSLMEGLHDEAPGLCMMSTVLLLQPSDYHSKGFESTKQVLCCTNHGGSRLPHCQHIYKAPQMLWSVSGELGNLPSPQTARFNVPSRAPSAQRKKTKPCEEVPSSDTCPTQAQPQAHQTPTPRIAESRICEVPQRTCSNDESFSFCHEILPPPPPRHILSCIFTVLHFNCFSVFHFLLIVLLPTLHFFSI